MVNSDLFLLFKTLTNKEIKQLSLFIDSPFANKIRYRPEAQILLKILQKHAGTDSEAVLAKQNIYKQVFPGKEFVSGLLERVMFELAQAIRLLLVTERYLDEKNSLNMQLDYAEILKSRDILAKANSVAHQTLEEIEKIRFKSGRDYGKAFEASLTIYSLATHKNRLKDDLQIANTLKYLELYYTLSKLDLVNHYLLINKFSKLESAEQIPFINTSITLPEVDVEEAPTIIIAYKIYQLLSNERPTQEGFEDLLHLLTKYEAQMGESTVKTFFVYLRNFCSFLVNDGHFEFFPILHQIQLNNLSKGYFFHQGKITPSAYLNIANCALRSKKESWAFDFIQEYQNKIVEASGSDQAYNLNMANYYFHTHDFDKSLDFLPPTSDNLEQHLFGRKLELQIYYEMRSDLLEYKLESFKMYIRRASQKLISEYIQERQINFANLLHQLATTAPGDRDRAARILGRIEEKKHVAEKEWLVEQAQKILKK